MISLNNIVKKYDDYAANNGISFDIPAGTIFGLLGPNGAGKTTLIRIITGITAPDAGFVHFNGKPFNADDRYAIGYMPEERGLYKKMKVGEQLVYLAQLKGLSKNDAKQSVQQWLSRLSIDSWWNKKVEELSKGMQQKVQFIGTVAHKPKLIILDEPFSGLDPINAEVLIHEIHRLKEDGATLIFSTHRMEQVEELCHRIVLINKGKNILEGNVTALRHEFKERVYEIELSEKAPAFLAEQYQLISEDGNIIRLKLSDEQASNELLSKLISANALIHNFQEVLPSLNEIFIRRVKEYEA